MLYATTGSAKTVTCWKPEEPTSVYYKSDSCPPGFLSGIPPISERPIAQDYSVSLRSTPPDSFEDRLIEKGVGGLVLGGAFGLSAAVIYVIRRRLSRAGDALRESVPLSVNSDATTSKDSNLLPKYAESRTHDRYYAQALNELDSDYVEKSTWARALVLSEGEPNKARSAYIRLRVAALASSSD